ncbi:peptidase S24 [Xylella fastidiosa subsp. sandyi Ann-1]|uniref:Peptidase S24 n=1 Tax=Xylella fastidiosa subsp. sandyi Ann-1 TaxID=155920 RepID=A0A060H7F8_XYLFS|nr:peptidase S24 [Xylella fastidiosa subsp. sandyi Ann-1]
MIDKSSTNSLLQVKRQEGDHKGMLDAEIVKKRFIAALGKNREVTQSAIATFCNVSEQAVSGWKRTGRIDKKHFAALSTALKVPLEYWYGEAYGAERVGIDVRRIRAVDGEEGTDPETDVMIPVYDLEVSGGPGCTVPEYVETRYKLPFQINWLRTWDAKPNDILIAKVRGSSMEDVLYEGDKVVIHTKRRRIRNDAVYALVYGGEARIKRLFVMADGSLRIVSHNPDKGRFPDEVVQPDNLEQVSIIGQVIDKMGSGGLGV